MPLALVMLIYSRVISPFNSEIVVQFILEDLTLWINSVRFYILYIDSCLLIRKQLDARNYLFYVLPSTLRVVLNIPVLFCFFSAYLALQQLKYKNSDVIGKDS